ncbi:MAG TPA: 16S rRNA (uracil(1498)-N(3))-methyltransferase [Rhizomicrobium sp.]|nr:16S rRNA (uracil(1498)-N(3))-methyltransferase [Rhizomicrobium sp.]
MTNDVTEAGGKTRLYVAADLGKGLAVALDEGQSHYLLHVLRAQAGNRVLLFNGRDGEWLAEIAQAGKRGVSATCMKQTGPQAQTPDIWLAFAPVKKTPSDYLVQKATELGAAMLLPVFTRRTIVSRVNEDRMAANAVEAAEQSGRLSVPEIRESVPLEKLLAAWPKERRLFFCDEGGDAKPLANVARGVAGPAAILTGPEGGFDPAERTMLRALPFVTPVTLGPRILRADTAAVAALAIWQSVAGDFQ